MAYYFKLLRGLHSEGGNVYRKGDSFESASDLSKHNKPQSVRFQILESLPSSSQGATAVAEGYTEGELKRLKIGELVQICTDEEIDIEGVPKRKKDLINEILKYCSEG